MSFFLSQAEAWTAANWEFSLVFEELADVDLWRRADSKLLSIGEIACHMVYWQVKYAAALDAADPIATPLNRDEARYYLSSVERPLELELTVAELAAEYDRVQKEVKRVFLGAGRGREDALTFEGPGRTFGEFADYMIFHVAYHTGQAFSVRHLMGHKTNDN